MQIYKLETQCYSLDNILTVYCTPDPCELLHAHAIKRNANTLQLSHSSDAPGNLVIAKQYLHVVTRESILSGINKHHDRNHSQAEKDKIITVQSNGGR